MIVGAGVELEAMEVMIGVGELVSVEEAAEMKLDEEELSVKVGTTDSVSEVAPSAAATVSLAATGELTTVEEDVADTVSVSVSDWVLETLSVTLMLSSALALAEEGITSPDWAALRLSVTVAVGTGTDPFTKVCVSVASANEEVAVAFIHSVNEVVVAFASSAGKVALE